MDDIVPQEVGSLQEHETASAARAAHFLHEYYVGGSLKSRQEHQTPNFSERQEA